ncbi:SNF2-related protein [Glutamicibacter sp.]|uniref:DEAD/DEAH box helicase n=1 Tax=Glutamicibacter sp. TaxID=1931995 RepID=UPI0028BDDB70|nr:SNF2-related protein [Glutamicibacter sp.]
MEYQLTPVAAQTLVTEAEYNQGWMIANSGQVSIADKKRTVGRTVVSGWVIQAFVTLQLDLVDSSVRFASHCDAHPDDYSCHDVAALLVEATQLGDGGFVVSDVPTAAPTWSKPQLPQWARTLTRLMPEIKDEVDEYAVEEEPLGLILKMTSSKAYGGRNTLQLGARPARPGSRSPWVQTGVSWRALPFDLRFSKEQRRAVNELKMLSERQQYLNYGHVWDVQDWLNLNTLPGRDLREAFEAMRDAGVAIVNGNSQARNEVVFEQEPATAFLNFHKDNNHVTIEPTLQAPDGQTVNVLALGEPPTLLAYSSGHLERTKKLRLAAFKESPSAQINNFISSGPMAVPLSELHTFEDEYLPMMRHMAPLRSTDSSYKIPREPRPVLYLDLAMRHREDAKNAALTSSFTWNYPPKAPRQHAVELEIIDSVDAKLGGEHPLGKPTAKGVYPDRNLTQSETIDFLLYTLPMLEEHPDVHVLDGGTLPDYRLNAEPAKVKVQVGEGGSDWFDLSVDVAIDGASIPFAQLLAALTAGEDYLVLDDYTVIPIAGEEFTALRQLVQEAGELGTVGANSIRIHKLSIDWWQELVDLGIIEAQENQWLEAMRKLTSTDALTVPALPESFTARLRPYQEHGTGWLNFLRTHNLGGVLADDMGLGKTVQLLACLEQARLENPEQKFLVLAPTSVVGNWGNEAARFAPQMRVRSITATAKKAGAGIIEQMGDAQLVVTSYTIFRLAFEEFERAGFSVMILDEAQQIKNHASKGYKQARQIEVPCKLVVTGTPMENNLMELWALVSLAAPGLLGGQKAFKENYDKPIAEGDAARLTRLKKRLRPFVLRRTKEQVVPELPAKTEQVLEVELEPAHRKAYDRRFQRVRQEVLGLVEDVDSNRFKILQSLTLLRQLALDPSLVDEGHGPSAKLELLREMIIDAVAEGHKVLIFSQFTSFLSKAREVAEELGIEHGYLDGGTSGPKRKALIDGFSGGEFPLFFISLKSGGFGINLTAADYCILLDPWWNPAAEAQAIDRAHRIGQENPVYVYRLVAKDTIESKVLALQAKKTALFNDVLGEDGEAGASTVLGAEDFLALME